MDIKNENESTLSYFEGPEKTLEVCFRLPLINEDNDRLLNNSLESLPSNIRSLIFPKKKSFINNTITDNNIIKGDCRDLTRSQLDNICESARCTILSEIKNDFVDAYILSESSLFIYSYKVILKTCGTTTLLRCLPLLLEYTKELGLILEWVGYSRKNYLFPLDQIFPHSTFDEELLYLKSHSHLSKKLEGSGYILGPITGDHWFVYVADKCDRPVDESTDRVINIMMFGLDPDVLKKIYVNYYNNNKDDNNNEENINIDETNINEIKIEKDKEENLDNNNLNNLDYKKIGKKMTYEVGIDNLVPGSIIDEQAFDPCGYSMNAICYRTYTTLHITPEEECSYASFETNNASRSYNSLIRNVLAVFRPERFVLTMFADEGGLGLLTNNPFDTLIYSVSGNGCYIQTSKNQAKVEGDCCCFMANYSHNDDPLLIQYIRKNKKRGASYNDIN